MFLQLTLLTLPLLTFAQIPYSDYLDMTSYIMDKYWNLTEFQVVSYQITGADVDSVFKMMEMDPLIKADEASSTQASNQRKYFATQTVWKDVPAEVTDLFMEMGRQQVHSWFASQETGTSSSFAARETGTPSSFAARETGTSSSFTARETGTSSSFTARETGTSSSFTAQETGISSSLQSPASISSVASSLHAKYSATPEYREFLDRYAQAASPMSIMLTNPSLNSAGVSSILVSLHSKFLTTQTAWESVPTELAENLNEAGMLQLQKSFAAQETRTSSSVQPPATYSSIASSLRAKYSTVPAYTEILSEFVLVDPPLVIVNKYPSLKADGAFSVLASEQSSYFATQTVWKDVPAEVTDYMVEGKRQWLQDWFAAQETGTSSSLRPPANISSISSSLDAKYSTVPAYTGLLSEFSTVYPPWDMVDRYPDILSDGFFSVLAREQSSYFATQTVWKDVPAEVTDYMVEEQRQWAQSWFVTQSTGTTRSFAARETGTSSSSMTTSAIKVEGETSALGAGNVASTSGPELMPINAQEDADSAAAELGVKMVGAALGGIVAVALFL